MIGFLILLKILLGTAVVAGVVTILAWSTVKDWMRSKKLHSTDVGNLVKTKMASGNYKVVVGVFSSGGVERDTMAWECAQLDEELNSQFGAQDKVRVTI